MYKNINIFMKQIIRLTESDLCRLIEESVEQILKEARSINSPKLYNMIQRHGGIKSNRGIFDIHNMTDNDIISVVNYNQLREFENQGYKNFAKEKGISLGIADEIDYIPLKDGYYILAICRGARFDRIGKQYNDSREKSLGDFEDLLNKKDLRTKNRFPRKDDYVWNNKKAEDLYKNPYFRNGEGDWTPQRKKEAMNNVRK